VVARERAERLRVDNCRVFHGTVDDFAATEEPFDLAVGLHTCGLLTDAVLSFAVRRGAAACVSPCCYGQVWSGGSRPWRGSSRTCPATEPGLDRGLGLSWRWGEPCICLVRALCRLLRGQGWRLHREYARVPDSASLHEDSRHGSPLVGSGTWVSRCSWLLAASELLAEVLRRAAHTCVCRGRTGPSGRAYPKP